jgi:hypothetical protein
MPMIKGVSGSTLKSTLISSPNSSLPQTSLPCKAERPRCAGSPGAGILKLRIPAPGRISSVSQRLSEVPSRPMNP